MSYADDKTKADAMFAEAMVELTSLTKASGGGTGLTAPEAVKAFAKSASVDASASGSIEAVGRRLQLAHRVSSLATDAIANGALDFAKAATERERIHARATELAKAQGTTPPTQADVDAMIARKRATGPRFAL